MMNTTLLTFILVQGIPQELSRHKGTLSKDGLALFERSLGEQSFTLKEEHRKTVKSTCCVSQACFGASRASATFFLSATSSLSKALITNRLNINAI